MWTFLRITILVGALYYFSGQQKSSTDPAVFKPQPVDRQLYIENTMQSIKEQFVLKGYACVDLLQSFEALADTLGAELMWDEKEVIADGEITLGETNGDTIWIYTPPCAQTTIVTFFHEVGHLKLHFDDIIRPNDLVEREAEAFGQQLAEWLRDVELVEGEDMQDISLKRSTK